jgi:hypothetical protein
MWEWLVQLGWSDVQRDANRLRHARMGHLPLEPSSDCLFYMPLTDSLGDLGPDGLHFVKASAQTQGEWGHYIYAVPPVMQQGWSIPGKHFIFPNRTVPKTQIVSRNIGFNSDDYLIEYQVFMAPGIYMNAHVGDNADSDYSSPGEHMHRLTFHAGTGELSLTLDNRAGGAQQVASVSNVVQSNTWMHFAMQKSGSNRIRLYLNRVLIVNVAANVLLRSIDFLVFDPFGEVIIRELSCRQSPVLPEVPFTPGPVTFASAFDPHLRFNSYML